MPVSVGPETPTESNIGAPAGGISYWWRVIGDWIKSLSPAGATEYETNWVDVTPATGWGNGTSDYLQVMRIGKTIHLRAVITRTGAAITVPADGNISNAGIAIIPPGFRPLTRPSGTNSGRDGRMAVGYVNPDGTLGLSATTPGSNIATNEAISFHGIWPVV